MPQHSGFEKLVADLREKGEWAEAADRRTHRFGSSEL